MSTKLRYFLTPQLRGGGEAACEGTSARGPWSNSERELHINYLELLAAFIAKKKKKTSLTAKYRYVLTTQRQ